MKITITISTCPNCYYNKRTSKNFKKLHNTVYQCKYCKGIYDISTLAEHHEHKK